MDQTIWDIAGTDGLIVVQSLLGKSVGYLAPFQSLETVLAGEPCSVLRLCDRNFRIRYAGDITQHISPLKSNVLVRQYEWLKAFSISSNQLQSLTKRATVRPPHRLVGLPTHQAVPAQLDTISMLIWRHTSLGSRSQRVYEGSRESSSEKDSEKASSEKSSVDIHTSWTDVERLKEKINNL